MPDFQIFKSSNAQIIEQLRCGNMDAFACLAFRYLKILSRYAHYFTRHAATSDMLATKALEQLWEHRTQMESLRSVHKFLHKQIYQQICNCLRQQLMNMKIPPKP